jgi:hypothetical protein
MSKNWSLSRMLMQMKILRKRENMKGFLQLDAGLT